MYLSTLFLSEMETGIEHAVIKCNEEFIRRFGTFQDHLSDADRTDSSGEIFYMDRQCDEMIAFWDVFKDFKDEIFMDLPIIKAMYTVRAARGRSLGMREK